MRSNYKKLGEFIKTVEVRNKDLSVSTLLGVSMEKCFIPSVANTNNVDLSKYKVVKKNQFACKLMSVGRDQKLPVDLLKNHDEAIVSSAYYVFETRDEELLSSDYLMMWLSRSETDRWVGYVSGGDVRGGISWDLFCELPIVVPSIQKQNQIVSEYKAIVNRIKLNEKVNKKLEATAQAIYKHWFVDFEFPISAEYAASIGKSELTGKPYKSSGGEMVFCEDLDQEIPKGWSSGGLHDLATLIDGDRGSNYPSKTEYTSEGYCLFLSTTNVTKDGFLFDDNNFITKDRDELLRKGKLDVDDIVLTTRGSVGNSAYFSKYIEYPHVRINSGMIIVRANKNQKFATYIFTMLKSSRMAQEIETFMSGSAQQHLPIKDIKRIPVILPAESLLLEGSRLLNPIVAKSDLIKKEIRQLKNLRNMLLIRISSQTSNIKEAA